MTRRPIHRSLSKALGFVVFVAIREISAAVHLRVGLRITYSDFAKEFRVSSSVV